MDLTPSEKKYLKLIEKDRRLIRLVTAGALLISGLGAITDIHCRIVFFSILLVILLNKPLTFFDRKRKELSEHIALFLDKNESILSKTFFSIFLFLILLIIWLFFIA